MLLVLRTVLDRYSVSLLGRNKLEKPTGIQELDNWERLGGSIGEGWSASRSCRWLQTLPQQLQNRGEGTDGFRGQRITGHRTKLWAVCYSSRGRGVVREGKAMWIVFGKGTVNSLVVWEGGNCKWGAVRTPWRRDYGQWDACVNAGQVSFRACAESLLWEKRRKRISEKSEDRRECGWWPFAFSLSFLLFFIQTWWSSSFQERQKVSPREAGMGCNGAFRDW